MLVRALLVLCLTAPAAARAGDTLTYLAFATGVESVRTEFPIGTRVQDGTQWRLELGQVRSPTTSLGLSASFTSGGMRQPDVTDLALALRLYPWAGATFVRASLGVSSVGMVTHTTQPTDAYVTWTYRGPGLGLGAGLQQGGKSGLAVTGQVEVVGRLLAARDGGAWAVPATRWSASAGAWLGVEWY